MKLIILSTILTLCLAEPPVPTYLPSNQNQVPQRPSTSYLPSNQGGSGHPSGSSGSLQVPDSNYLASNQEKHPQLSRNLPSNYLPPNQNQVQSSNYLPPNQNQVQSSNYLPPNQNQVQSSNYLPPNQNQVQSSNYLPPNQNQVPSSNYIPSNQVSQTHVQSSGNPGASYLPPNQGYPSGSDGNGNRRPQQEVEKNAAIVRQDQEIKEDGYHYAYETSNGIRAEEAGDAWQSQGGFSYKGDDGITYKVTYTAGEDGGFQPRGDHLPVAPPIPDDILAALKKNEEDEAKGIFDDGKYRPDEHGGPQNKPGYGHPSQSPANNQHGSDSNSGYQY